MNNERSEYQRQYRKDYRRKTKRVNLTFSNSEYRDIVKSAEKEQLKVTTYTKQLVLQGQHQQAHIPKNLSEELRTLRFAIRNIANNVNQLTHYSHTIRELASSDEKSILQYLKQLETAVQRYTEGRILDHDH